MAVLPRRAVAPLRQFVLKVHSRCNLACDHCYVYEHADQGWRIQPALMEISTVGAAARRIAEHARRHELDRVTVVLHGGEPLLLGAARLRAVLAELRSVIDPVVPMNLRMQSNGLLLTETIGEVLAEFGVRVGISLDGDQVANDRHRRFASGASSHAGVVRALEVLRQHRFRRTFSGILCTVDIRNDPIEVYEALMSQRPPRLDFLLPHATWDRPPLRPNGDPAGYGAWLATVYRRWFADGRPVPIRLFDSLLSAAAGGSSGTEWVGLDSVDLAVVETDGSWEQVDSLKTSYSGAAYTGLNVFRHPVDEVAGHPGIVHRQGGMDSLCETCRSCPIVHQCGGGLYAHRYRSGYGFDNPTVYCADVKELATAMFEHSPPSTPSQPSSSPQDDFTRVLEDLAAGYGDEVTMRYLADKELAITRALLVAVGTDADLPRRAQAGWNLICRLDEVAPDAVRAVVRHPYVRVWAMRYLDDPWPAAVAALNNLAAAAAIVARAEAEISVTVRDGRVVLPTLGSVVLGASADSAVLSASVNGFAVHADGVKVDVPLADLRGDAASRVDFRPSHRVEIDGLSIRLEDQDPYRDCHQWSAAAELADHSVESWRRSLTEAWRLIQDEVPGQLPGVHNALTVLMPLATSPDGDGRSATARHAFGSVAVAPASAVKLAELLVHELQHIKLGAVLDLVDLFDPTFSARLDVAWRTDRRPIEGALQGTYAHLSLTDLWRRRAELDGPARARAAREYRKYRDWTAAALDALLATHALTPAGDRFVARMALTLAGWAS